MKYILVLVATMLVGCTTYNTPPSTPTNTSTTTTYHQSVPVSHVSRTVTTSAY